MLYSRGLRLGNIIRYTANGHTADGEVCLLNGYEEFGVKEYDGRLWGRNVAGIPISEEVLLKYGFELQDPIDRVFRLVLSKLLDESLNCTAKGVVALVSDDGEGYKNFIFEEPIAFEHELQNLYFSITKRELNHIDAPGPWRGYDRLRSQKR